jgi:hypothetical protein
MEDYVADIAAPPMEAAASSCNSEFPTILMILSNDHRLLQKLQQILLLQRTFETFPNCMQKAQECKQEQENNCHSGRYLCQKCFDTQYNRGLGANERRTGSKI